MFKFVFDLFDKTVWSNGFIFKDQQQYSIFLYVGLMLAIAAAAYLLGSVNSAVIFSRLMYGEDIRQKGSGNAGMTNMMRTYGNAPAALTLVCDMLKTLVAMAIGTSLCGVTGAYIAGLFAVVGHVFPIYYGFKGGKGVASSAMMILYLNAWAFLILVLMFVLIVWATKYLSLASVICILVYPLMLYRMDTVLTDRGIRLIITLIVAGIVFFKHRTNISRIMNGTESRFSFKRTAKKPQSEDSAEDTAEEPDDKEKKRK